MEIGDENEMPMKCFQNTDRLLECLNIVYNESNTMFIFWNKYQIFVYEDLNFESAAKIFVPEFQVRQIIVFSNYLVFLDCSGSAHVTSLKFKNSAQKRFKSSFQPREQGLLNCLRYSADTTLSLKFELDTYLLCLHKVNAEFQLEKKTELSYEKDQWKLPLPTQGNNLLHCHTLTNENFESIKEMFNVKGKWKEHKIILISFDKKTVFGCLFSQSMRDEEIKLVKLYISPSEICDITIIEIDIIDVLIGLKSGTLIKLQLKHNNKTPDIVHLNTALSKFIALKPNDILYTDGITMWKAENAFKKEDIKFKQLFLKNSKDFVKFGDWIISTTFTNLIYKFSIENIAVFLKTESIDEYCSAEKFLNNSECLNRIMKEVEKNNEVIKNVNEEGNYITALSLSNRQDIMDTIINQNIIVYENYEDAIKDNTDVTLTEELKEYFKTGSFFFLIKITTDLIQHALSNILSNIFGDLKIHTTLSSKHKVLKTTSLKIKEPLKKVQVLIPLDGKKIPDATHINVDIKIVTSIPGALDHKQTTWTYLYRKCVVLNSEHFIKTNTVTHNTSLKEPDELIEDLIVKTSSNQHGDLFKITGISECKTNSKEWSLCIKLPDNYIEIFKTEGIYKTHLNARKANYLFQQFTSEDFWKSKSNVCLEIGKEKIKLMIENDFSSPLLKVTCENMKIAFSIRNFLANFIYNDFKSYCPGKEFVKYSLYTTTENLQKAVKKSLVSGSQEEFIRVAELFQRSVIGALPI